MGAYLGVLMLTRVKSRRSLCTWQAWQSFVTQ